MSHLTVREVQENPIWEAYISTNPEANFLQSWNWGVFHQSLGKKTFYLGLFSDTKQIGAALCVKEQAKRGTYLSIAGGPIVDWDQSSYLNFFLDSIKDIAKQQGCDFIRMRPQVLDTPTYRHQLKILGWNESPMHLTADLTLQLDLSLSEEALLSQMRKNTRYEVNKSQKTGITIETSSNPEDIRAFYNHQVALAEKHHFVPFSYDFLFKQFQAFVLDDQVLLFHSYLEKKLLASAFIIFYNQEAVYHYGISTPDNQRLPGAYACQWAAILEAKKRGCKNYNFWGISPEDQPNHRFAGVSLFKQGFGGQEVAYLPAHDLPISAKYYLTKGFEWMRKKVRKL